MQDHVSKEIERTTSNLLKTNLIVLTVLLLAFGVNYKYCYNSIRR